MFHALLIAALLSLGGLAHAAGLPQLRGEVASADSQVVSARTQRTELQRALDEVARQIEARKARQGSGLFRDSQLDGLLKTSQELSSRMTGALHAENEAEEALRGGQARLADELEGELARLRGRWEAATTREERAGLLQQLKALRAERDSLRGSTPAALPRVSDRPSEDPEELLERADALLDGEDKLRREEKALERRIAELKSERELERRMNEFLSEDSLFDEHDRRLSIARPGRSGATTGESNPAPTAAVDSPKTAGDVHVGSVPPELATGGEQATFDGRDSVDPMGSEPSAIDRPGNVRGGTILSEQEAADVLLAPRIGTSRSPPERHASGMVPYSDDESLEELVARQGEVRRLADELHRKANEAASRAQSLR